MTDPADDSVRGAQAGEKSGGRLHCIPTPIAPGRELADDLGAATLAIVRQADYVIAEHPRTARAFLKQAGVERPIQAIEVATIESGFDAGRLNELLEPLRQGRDALLVSEAGCPGVADPGAALVLAAHAANIDVVVHVGPSALLLALMGSGLEGQRFAFAGYVPAATGERHERLLALEARSRRESETILIIETPYRSEVLFQSLIAALHETTRLCVASGLTGANSLLKTRTVKDWRGQPPPRLDRVPTVFLFEARGGREGHGPGPGPRPGSGPGPGASADRTPSRKPRGPGPDSRPPRRPRPGRGARAGSTGG